MDGLIPFVLKALKKKKTMKHYRSLSSSTDRLAHLDVAEIPPKGCLFMTPQHPKAPRWNNGEGDLFMTPQHPRASRWLHDGDGRGNPAPATGPLADTHNPSVQALATPSGMGVLAGASLARSEQEVNL